MPSEDSVGRDDARHLLEQPTSETPAEHAKAPALVVTQTQTSPVQLGPKHTVLFAEERDDVALLTFEPSEQRREEQVERAAAGHVSKDDQNGCSIGRRPV